MFLNNLDDQITYKDDKPYDENLELQEMLAYQSKNDINDTQFRQRRLSGISQNPLQSSNTRLKTSQLNDEFDFLKMSREQQIFYSNCAESSTSSNIGKVNFDFQKDNNQSIVADQKTKHFEKCIQMKNQKIKKITLELQSKNKQIAYLKQLNADLGHQLTKIKSLLQQYQSQKNQLKQSIQYQSKSIQYKQITFLQNCRINSPKQKVMAKNNIVFNRVSPIYKQKNTICLQQEVKNKIKKEYENIIEFKDKMIDQLEQKYRNVSIQLQNDKLLSKRIVQLQQQLRQKAEIIHNLEWQRRQNDLKMEQSTQDEEVGKQNIQRQSNYYFLSQQLISKQRKIQQLYQEIEIMNSTIDYTQNQMMKIEIERIDTEIQKQFFKEKLHKYQLQHCSPNQQEFKKLKTQKIISMAPLSNSLKSIKFTPQMLSPKQTVDFMVKVIKKAVKSKNIRGLIEKSPYFLESINELLQLIL